MKAPEMQKFDYKTGIMWIIQHPVAHYASISSETENPRKISKRNL